MILGLILLKVINMPFSDVLTDVMGFEIAEDSTDIVFTLLSSFLEAYPFTVTLFLSGYLIFWGTVDIILSVSLLRHKLWAFPVSLGLISLFIIYASYRFTHTHSLMLLLVIIIDIGIFWLIKNEYTTWKNRVLNNEKSHPLVTEQA